MAAEQDALRPAPLPPVVGRAVRALLADGGVVRMRELDESDAALLAGCTTGCRHTTGSCASSAPAPVRTWSR